MLYPIILALLVSLYGIYTIPEIKGWVGERVVRLFLSVLRDEFIIINNIYIPAYDGMYTQIDHIVIAACGIIVIETKNYSGKLSGSSRKKYWTAKRGGESAKVYNPIRQNSYHVKMLKDNCPQLDGVEIFSVICLASGAKVDIRTKIPITGPVGLVKVIKELSKTRKKYNKLQIREIEGTVRGIAIVGDSAAKEHKKMLTARKERFRRGYCPRCNAKLLRKRGVRGEYLICSNYPICKFRASNGI